MAPSRGSGNSRDCACIVAADRPGRRRRLSVVPSWLGGLGRRPRRRPTGPRPHPSAATGLGLDHLRPERAAHRRRHLGQLRSRRPPRPGRRPPSTVSSTASPWWPRGRVFAATENDTVYALAADTGAVLWSHHLGTPFDPSTVPGLCGDIHPDRRDHLAPRSSTPARSEIFVVADRAGSPGGASHHLIGLDLYTGAVLLDEVIDPPGADPAFELQRASLALDRRPGDHRLRRERRRLRPLPRPGRLGPRGRIAPVDLRGGQPARRQPGRGVDGRGGPAVDAQGNVWVATGNSAFHTSADPYDDSDSVLELSPTMQLLDSFAPTDLVRRQRRGRSTSARRHRRSSPTGWSSTWASRRPPTSSTSRPSVASAARWPSDRQLLRQ